MALDTSQFRNGLKIELDGEPFAVVYFQHVKPGKGGAFVRTKLKNLKTGRVLDRRFRAGERVEEADIEDRKMQYLYQDGDQLVFMDSKTYEQTPFSSEQVGDARKFLKENLDEYKKLVKDPKFVCKNCGRAAASEKNLCNAEKL